MIAAPDLDSPSMLTTDGEIAVINLESARRRSWTRFFEDPLRSGVAEAVVEHEQLASQFVGDLSALARLEFIVTELAKVDAASARTALIQVRVASTTHRFAEARHYLAQAEDGGAPSDDVQALSLNIDQACGRDLDKVLDVRRHRANEFNRLEDLVALGAVLADIGETDDADRTYTRALTGYQDVSPFPLAWTYFQLGMLWGELAPERDQSRAAEWYRRAIEVLPGYTKARIHLAEIYCSCGRLSEAETLLAGAVSSRDPEVRWRLADVTAARERPCESEVHMEAARAGYDYLIARHLLAFADHGAEFYAGSGNDFRRALHLARVNIANRPTLRAFEQGYTIAACGGDNLAAIEILDEATKRWGATAGFRRSSLSRNRVDGLEGAAA